MEYILIAIALVFFGVAGYFLGWNEAREIFYRKGRREGWEQGYLDNHNRVMNDSQNDYVKEMKKISITKAQMN